jgi:hypothetical protein
MMESLTNSLVEEATKIIDEVRLPDLHMSFSLNSCPSNDVLSLSFILSFQVEAVGGMTKAIECGMAKLRIEESATRKQVCKPRACACDEP